MMKNAQNLISDNSPVIGKTKFQNNQTPLHILNYLTISLILYVRDLFNSPKIVLREAPIKHGITVLDYGCGPGNYSIAVSELLDGTGEIFALDKHPLAIKSLSKKIEQKNIQNIGIIQSDCKTGLAPNSVDVVLLYHVFNDLKNPEDVLMELHRIIKPSGILSFSEFDLERISSNLANSGFFQLEKKMGTTHTFVKK